jgi:predicted flap endonuclease-1-like 5' DNA nuclease
MAAPGGPPDDLQQIKGIGPKLVTLLNSLGVTRFDQIAGWSAEELAAIDARLGNFQGRPMRDRWQEQARLLASRDLKAFERLHGKIGDQA